VTLPERETELRLLCGAITAAGAGEGSVTVVTGPLGVGKTALLKEVLRIAPTRPGAPRVLTASASRTEQDFDFGVACQVLEPVVAEAGEHDAERWFAGTASAARWLFPGAPGWPGWEPDGHHDVLTAHGLAGLLAAIAADRPLVVLVDDLHVADRQSLTWLRQCARRIREVPCALVVAVREGDPGADRPAIRELWELAKTRIRPPNLSEAGVAAALRAASDARAGDARFVAACHVASAGNPLYLTEAVRGDHRTGPSLLKERLTAQLAVLPPGVGECAKAIAVLGDHAEPWLVERLTGGDSVAVAEAVRALRRLGILGPAAPPRFAAPVVRAAVEASTTAPEDLRLRLRAATVFHEAGFAAETVAAQLLEVPAPSPSPWMPEELRTAADAVEGGQHDVLVTSKLLAGFAALGLGLAALGLYGVISGLVGQRRHEFGIRLALGAQPHNVVQIVLKSGTLLAAVGTLLGLALCAVLLPGLAAAFPALPALDVPALLGVVSLLFAVALLACWLPARRASKVDPMTALRAE